VLDHWCKDKLGPMVLRLALGLVCIYHGYLKIMAAGGTAWLPGLPVGWQFLIAWGEFSAGLAMLVGFHCRVAAAMVLSLMSGTLIWWQGWNVLHLPIHTLEPTILLSLVGLALLFLGAGELSLDGRLAGKKGAGKALKKS
jgi:uncharacterized membrane protein YphA (DoxX/SURF4 family)